MFLLLLSSFFCLSHQVRMRGEALGAGTSVKAAYFMYNTMQGPALQESVIFPAAVAFFWGNAMTDDNKKTGSRSQDSVMVRRREERYPVPEVYRQYFELRIRAQETFVTVALDNLSRSGILFESPLPLPVDSRVECLISVSRSLSKEVSFAVRVKHCRQSGGSFLVGAAIDSVADEVWFDIFLEVHDFIIARQGSIY